MHRGWRKNSLPQRRLPSPFPSTGAPSPSFSPSPQPSSPSRAELPSVHLVRYLLPYPPLLARHPCVRRLLRKYWPAEHRNPACVTNRPTDGWEGTLTWGNQFVISPMKYCGMTEPGKHLGLAGLGGLGHVAVKFGNVFGLKVTVICSSPRKEAEALERLGADALLPTSYPAKAKAAMGSVDYIIDTISAVHSLPLLLSLLKLNGKLITVGLPDKPPELPISPLVLKRRLIGVCNFGCIKETEEILEFCAKHGIATDVEVIRIGYINTALECLAKSDAKYRFVIDMANSLSQ